MKFRLGRSITKLFKPGMLGMPDTSAAEGILVTCRRGYLQVFDGTGIVLGVYTGGSYRRMYQMDGEMIDVTIPEGIIVYGNASIKCKI